MSRHRSPQGRRAHHGPPLSALVAAAGAGGAHRSVSMPQVAPTPGRAIAALVVGGALAASGQQALSTALPAIGDGVAAMRVSFDRAVGLAPTSHSATATPVASAPAVADASALVKAANLAHVADAAPAARGAVTAPAAGLGAVAAQAPSPGLVARASAPSAFAPVRSAPAVAPRGGRVQIIAGPVTSGFGARWGRVHQGIDIAAPIGTPIHVPMAGVVISSGPASGFGLWVRVQHPDGTITVYGHINRSFVSVGQEVAAGDVIAETGNRGQSTGPHLHIGVLVNGTYVNPRPWLDAHGMRY